MRANISKLIGDHCIDGVTTGSVTVRANENGVGVAHRLRETHYTWPSFLAVFEENGTVFLKSTATSGVIIPDKAFNNAAERESLLALAQAQIPQTA